MKVTRKRRGAIAGALCLLLPFHTAAETAGDDSTLIYPASFFLQYEPVSANDMLARIPGISLVLDAGTDSGLRGLGAGENEILIDGRRVAGKENEGRDQLGRIAASSVDHIEIIRSTSGDMDVRSSGVVINIVLNEKRPKHNIAAEFNLLRYPDHQVDPGGLISLAGQREELNYIVSLEAKSLYEYRVGHETSVLADHSPNDARPRAEIRDQMSYTASSSLSYRVTERDTLRLNGLYRKDDPPVQIERMITDFTTTPATVSRQKEMLDASSSNWELGSNYEHRTDDGDRYKLLLVVNDANYDSLRNRYTTPTGGAQAHDLFLLSDSRNRERILRASWIANLGERQELELGVERAQTILDTKLLLGLPGIPGTPSPTVGGLVPVPLPNSTSTVEEMRYEAFAVHDWHIGERASLESSLVAEFSKISQSGDVHNSRRFHFLRPKFSYRFDVTPSVQVRASVTRFVSQLSFADFAAAVDAMDDDRNSISGNPELVQEKSWQYDLRLEYRLPDDGGVFNARVFYYAIEDVIDMIDVSSPTQLDSAPGNIGDGRRYGLDLNGSFRFSFVGLPDAVLTAALSVERSRVTDPFLDVERPLPMRGRGNARLGFQHDLTGRGVSYGFNYFYPLHGDLMRYDISTIEDYETDPTMTMFVEKSTSRGITYRLESINTFDGYRCRIRTRYNGGTWSGSIAEIEDACSTPGQTIALKVRGNF